MALLSPTLVKYTFTLNAWGVAGIFGGEETLSAMPLVLLSRGNRWLGWYNSPGSLFVARHLGHLVQSHFWKRIFPHTSKSPATLFGFDGEGPGYTSLLSGIKRPTGHLGNLAVTRCNEILDVTHIPGGSGMPADVALIDVEYDHIIHAVPHLSMFHTFLAIIPTAVSVVTCVMCAVVYDWYSFSVILIGILAGGLASIAIGSGRLVHISIEGLSGAPRGDGILFPVHSGGIDIVVVKGIESAVNVITRGTFILQFTNGLFKNLIGICSLLFIIEFLVQLLLIPQGTLFGQLMFVISICVSWAYNFHVSSLRRGRFEADLLFQMLGNPQIRRFRLDSRTSMTVFTALLLCREATLSSPSNVKQLLRTLIPDEGCPWEQWRERVTRMVCDQSPVHLDLDVYEKELDELTGSEKEFLRILLRDARSAFDGYLQLHFGAKQS